MEKASKTKRKREALSLQDLGEKLTGLNEQQLREIQLPEHILKEVLLARSISKHGARKRQMQYLGVLMRKLEDPAPIREALQSIEEGRTAATRQHQLAEAWRKELIGGNDAVLDDVLARFPSADRAELTRLVQDAREEHTKLQASPAPARALYRYLFSLSTSPL